VQIEIWSDVLCPWCAVGRARLQTAVEAVGEPVEIRWRSFELTPQAPRRVEGDYLRRLGDKYGWSPAKTRLMVDQMVETAAAHGLDFDFSIIRPGNTFDAHRLLHLAAERDCQDALKARFFQAYLGEGQPIGEPATLARLAVEVGLDADEVHTVLMSDAYGDAVRLASVAHHR
jgi:predicted DsbA family dithiol-disulfide isomerase